MSRLESYYSNQIVWSTDRGQSVPDHFGNPTAELHTLQTSAALLDFTHYECLALAGEERQEFLGGLITNQIKKVTASQSIYTAHLTPQGRFLWDFTILHDENRLLLITEPNEATPLAARIAFFILRSKVKLERSESHTLLGIAGPKATTSLADIFPQLALESPPLGATFTPEPHIQLWQDPRHPDFGWRLRVPVEAVSTWWARLSQQIPPAGFFSWETYRIQQELPRSGNELIPEVSLALEAGLIDMHGVDFTKGCYIGQETTTRTHHRGTLKKRLFSLMLSQGDALALKMPISLPNGKEVGILTSITPDTNERAGLGIIHLADAENEQPLTIGTQQVTARKPKWASW